MKCMSFSAAIKLNKFKLLCCVVVFALTSCGSIKPDPQTEVRRLASQRWQALLSGRIEDAYNQVVPSFRALRSLDKYKQNIQGLPVKWLEAEVMRVDCEHERCRVHVRLVSQLLIPSQFKGKLDGYTEETWVYEQGRWWMVESF